MSSRILHPNSGKMISWLSLVGLWLVIVQGAWTATQTLWPGLHEDGAYYSTIPINLANGLGHAYSVYARSLSSADVPEPHRDHGQLYAPLISYLMKGNSSKSLLTAIHWVNFASLFLAVSFYFLLTRRLYNATCLFSLWVATGFSCATIATMHYLQGRPEHGMVVFLLLAGLVGELRWKSLWPNWFYGLVIGVSASFSPLPGTLWAIGTTIALACQVINSKELITATISRFLFAVTTWSLLNLFFSSESIIQVISNTIERGGMIQSTSYLPKSTGLFFILDWLIHWFSPYWIILSYAPGLIFPFLLSAIFAIGKVIRAFQRQSGLIFRLITVVCTGILAHQIFRNSIVKPGVHYNLLPLMPGLFSWLLAGFSRFPKIELIEIIIQEKNQSKQVNQKKLTIHSKLYQTWFPSTLLILCSLPGVGYLRSNLMQSEIQNKGVSYDTAYKRYQALKLQLLPNEYILIDEISHANSKSAVIFDGPSWKTVAYNGDIDALEQKLSIKIKFFFDLQERSITPEDKNGFRLIEINFNNSPAFWNGVMIKALTPGYGYVVYERNANPP